MLPRMSRHRMNCNSFFWTRRLWAARFYKMSEWVRDKTNLCISCEEDAFHMLRREAVGCRCILQSATIIPWTLSM